MTLLNSICLILQDDYETDARVRRKAESLVAEGWTVDVVALRAKSRPHASRYHLKHVTVYTLPLRKKRGFFYRYIYEYIMFFIIAFFKLSLLMLQKRYKVIDVNTLPDFLVFAAIVPKWLGAKLVLDMHEVMPEFYMSKYGVGEGHWLILLIRFMEKYSMLFADHVITINEPIQELLESRGLQPQKATILMNSADESLFDNIRNEGNASMPQNFVMMFHGTLTSIYGLDIAFNAFATVSNEMPNAEFWILGNGPERAALENLVQKLKLAKKIKFKGMVPLQEIPEWLSRCDVGVLPTRQDVFLDLSFSNKLPEYIIMGKPVIASRLKAIRYYFTEQALAFFEPHNPYDLGQRMLYLYRNPNQRAKLADQAKREYTTINWDVMKQRYLNLIKDIIKP